MAEKEQLLEEMRKAVIEFDEDRVKELANRWIELGYDANEAIFEGLAAGMEVVGELFAKNEYFVPEVLMCADALYAGLDILRPHIKAEDRTETKGVVVIGTVEGDVHDIGKNLVKLMFEVAGFEVHDLGKDVPLEKFVEEQLRTDADLVCLSAMMTTTMPGMKKVIEMLRERNPNVKIMIGGAPVSEKTVEMYGADATGKDAASALEEAIRMVSSLREMKRRKEI
ncbi:MAG: cobalamin-binding protein [Euryarchaeota archaeon]|nr:cobalamin-binding protein [Euryarchaeota archaeon]